MSRNKHLEVSVSSPMISSIEGMLKMSPSYPKAKFKMQEKNVERIRKKERSSIIPLEGAADESLLQLYYDSNEEGSEDESPIRHTKYNKHRLMKRRDSNKLSGADAMRNFYHTFKNFHRESQKMELKGSASLQYLTKCKDLNQAPMPMGTVKAHGPVGDLNIK